MRFSVEIEWIGPSKLMFSNLGIFELLPPPWQAERLDAVQYLGRISVLLPFSVQSRAKAYVTNQKREARFGHLALKQWQEVRG